MKMTLHIKKSSTICKSQHKNDSSEFKIMLNLRKIYKMSIFQLNTKIRNEIDSHRNTRVPFKKMIDIFITKYKVLKMHIKDLSS